MEQGVSERHPVKGFGRDWYNGTIVETTQNYDILSKDNYHDGTLYECVLTFCGETAKIHRSRIV